MRLARFAAGLVGPTVGLVVSVAAALACASYVTFSSPPGSRGGVPVYPPGSTVTMSGHDFDPAAATPVTVHWGGDGGPVVGQAPIDPEGGWTVSFQIPADAAMGRTYVVSLQSRGADGQMSPGLPVLTSLRVDDPAAAPPARAPAPRARPATGSIEAVVPARARPHPPTVVAAPAHPARTATAPVPTAARAPAAVPARPAASSAPRRFSRPPLARRPSAPAVARRARLEDRRALPVAAASRPAAAPVAGASTPRASDDRGAPPAWALAGALALLLAGGAGAAGLRRRRRPLPSGDPERLAGIEAELQELLAEEAAARDERVREPAAR